MTEVVKNEDGSIVMTSNTLDKKLDAMLNLSKSIYELTKQLAQVNITVDISNCTISNCSTGIELKNE